MLDEDSQGLRDAMNGSNGGWPVVGKVVVKFRRTQWPRTGLPSLHLIRLHPCVRTIAPSRQASDRIAICESKETSVYLIGNEPGSSAHDHQSCIVSEVFGGQLGRRMSMKQQSVTAEYIYAARRLVSRPQ